MPRGYQRLIVNASHRDAPQGVETFGAGVDSPPPLSSSQPFSNDEEAARFYLADIMGRSEQPTIRSFSPDGPPAAPQAGQLPDLVPTNAPELSLTGTRLVAFQQHKSEIPVFGSRASVELDLDQELIAASVTVADVAEAPTEPGIDASSAVAYLLLILGNVEVPIPEPALVILPLPESESNHLAWHFHEITAAPGAIEKMPPAEEERRGCCDLNAGPLPPSYDYFIDAFDGSLLYFFSRQPRVEVPTWCQGEDENHDVQTFFGRSHSNGYEMNNNFEDILTFDMQHKIIELNPIPSTPVQNSSNHWHATNRAAVSAHVNASRVMDFLFSVLRRDSIDDSGFALENIVNCVSDEVPAADRPEWINAAWWQGKMWYGQKDLGGGNYQSLAIHLDIIAHELFHGVTESTADLVYRDLPGALNESFSDIFGVIICNWYLAPDRLDPSTWNWQMGAGLGSGGNPMRDMSNPGSVGEWWKPDAAGGWTQVMGYPDHMNDHVALPANYDHGGVHIFSNIHNKAAYNLLMANDPANGTRIFTVQEIAVLYYLTLVRLTAFSDFQDARAELLSVASTLYGGSVARHQLVQSAIEDAYDAVGII